MIALGMFAMVGCQEYSIDSQPEAAANIQDDALESYIMAAESATSIVFNISANTPWRIDRDENAQWCTVTPSMSATSSLVAEVTVTVEDNETFSPRKATLTITAAEIEGWSKTITINQMSKGDFLITEWAEDIEAEGGVATYFIYTNKAWEYRPVTSYLSVDAEYDVAGEDVDDIVTYELRINVPANTGVARDARFMIHTATADYEYSIHQIGMELRLADGMEANTTFGSAEIGAQASFDIKANVDWSAAVDESCADWLKITEITKDGNNGTITVELTGENQTLTKREGVINLTASGIEPVAISVYQPSPVKLSYPVTENEDAVDCILDNGDGSVTVRFGSTQNETILYLPETGKLGSWTYEFDPERTNIEQVHLYFAFQATLGDGSSNGCRSALTPYQAAPAQSGVTNNFIMNNHAGVFATTPQRWNLDGVQINTFPVKQGDEALPVEAVKRLEKVTYEFGPEGMAIRIYADGKYYEAEMPLTNPGTQFDAYKNAVTAYKANFRVTDPMSVRPFNGEYVTITKFYFTPFE